MRLGLPDGQRFHNAMRVTPSDDGCAVAFVLLRMPGVTDEAFENDAAHVARDLGGAQGVGGEAEDLIGPRDRLFKGRASHQA